MNNDQKKLLNIYMNKYNIRFRVVQSIACCRRKYNKFSSSYFFKRWQTTFRLEIEKNEMLMQSPILIVTLVIELSDQ